MPRWPRPDPSNADWRARDGIHFELFNQRRRDMPKCGRDDYCVEGTAFQPSVITVADFDAHVVTAEVSQHLCSAFGQWRDNLNSTNLPRHTRQYCGLVA